MTADLLAAIAPAGLGLGPIAAAALVVTIFGRDDDYNIDDYKPKPAEPHIQPAHQPGRWTHLDQQQPVDILPPAPPGTTAGGTPIYRQTVVAQMFAGFDAAQVAADELRRLGEQARQEAAR